MQLALSQVSKSSQIVALFIIFCIFNFLDATLTNYLISLSDTSTEANPVVRWFITRGANSALLLYFWKFIMLSLVAFVSHLCVGTKYEMRWYRILIGANALMLAIVTWSVYLAIVI